MIDMEMDVVVCELFNPDSGCSSHGRGLVVASKVAGAGGIGKLAHELYIEPTRFLALFLLPPLPSPRQNVSSIDTYSRFLEIRKKIEVSHGNTNTTSAEPIGRSIQSYADMAPYANSLAAAFGSGVSKNAWARREGELSSQDLAPMST